MNAEMNANTTGQALLTLARSAIARSFDTGTPEPAVADALRQPGAAFVTLTQQGRLRGCIGSLEAWRPLADDIRENAVAAAFRDPRFPPLAQEELASTHVEVSLLSKPETILFSGEADALAQLQPNIDGVIFECDGRRSTFLPQVWEQLPEPRLFMEHLKEKAGFSPDFWSPDVKLWRYGVDKWKES
jgi:AmmeMemoRadiSam system protein A